MSDMISPKYHMKLVAEVEAALEENYNTNELIQFYLNKWHREIWEGDGYWENFKMTMEYSQLDVKTTLHQMDKDILLQIAVDLGIETPNFLPSVATFKNEIKSSYKTAYDTFSRAYKEIETDPSLAIGMANSALESIIKEILKDDRIKAKTTDSETLYKLTLSILKEFKLLDDGQPKEIKTIGTAFSSISQAIETLRSEMTNFHGKTSGDYLIKESILAHLVVNAVTTVGLFLNAQYRAKFKQPDVVQPTTDDLPF